MNEERRLPGNNTEVIAEYRLLNALVKNPLFLNDPRMNPQVFVTETARSIYEAIVKLRADNIEITPASLLQAGYEIDYMVNSQVVQEVFNISKEAPSTLDDMLSSLDKVKLKSSLIAKLDDTRRLVSANGDIDSEKVLGNLYSLDEMVAKASTNKSKLLSFGDWTDRYINDLEQRRLGRKYSFGDPLLDQYIFKGAAPGNITIITAGTNMGKSTYVLSLIDNLIDMNVPCMYISLEMGTIDTMDRLIAKRLGVENKALYDPESIEGIIEQVKQEKDTLSKNHNFYFCEATGVDMVKLTSLIREFKQKTHQDYCLVAIDLLSGMKGFMASASGSSTASSIELNMNRLEEIAKEENVHIVGVVQLNRQSDNLKISHVEEIDRLRPALGDVKNSGAYAEKATTLLALFRKKFYADRYCKNDPATANMNDILEVQVLKDRNSQAGKVFQYMFDGKFFKLFPLMDDDSKKLDDLKNLDIDY